ncbi:MAG: DUF1326 domain-containing protein [Candidatus Rokubacteria bacterium]|nr:DUF1326 domain-containing protein [Candidatus Rokubacteria bacterium]
MGWSLRGEYVENCNCDLFCPCLLGPRDPVRGLPMAPPSAGHCDLPAVFHVERGAFDGVALDGLTVVLAIRTRGRMSDGDWRAAPYLPQEATPDQRQALTRIFLGQAGGPMARVAQVVGEWYPPALVPITYAADGVRRRVQIPGVLDLEVEGILGADGSTEVWIRNLKHLACRMMASAIGRRGDYQDHGMRWNHAGKNAHYGPFEWAV